MYQKLRGFIVQSPILILYLLFSSISDPHWDNCSVMFATGKFKMVQLKLDRILQLEVNKNTLKPAWNSY